MSHERLAGTDCWIGDGQDWLTFEQTEELADDLASMAPWLIVSASHCYERHNRMDLTGHTVTVFNPGNGQRWSIGTCDQARQQRAIIALLAERADEETMESTVPDAASVVCSATHVSGGGG